MAIIKCPECGKEISDKAEKCIHCGYPLYVDISEKTEEEKENKCSVMLIEYEGFKFVAANHLADVLEIEKDEAKDILSDLPCYILKDVERKDADYVAEALKEYNMRLAVYDEKGNVKYFENDRYYNRPIPVFVPYAVRYHRRPIPIIIRHRPPQPGPMMPRGMGPRRPGPAPRPSVHINLGGGGRPGGFSRPSGGFSRPSGGHRPSGGGGRPGGGHR